MALHDTDPNTTNRAEPMPQSSDQNPVRVSDGTTAITNKQDGSSGAYVSTKDATVKVNDGTDNRVALGLLSDGSYGLKVSQPGFDVLSAADDELIFNSGQNVFKIVGKHSGTLAALTATNGAALGATSATTFDVYPHGLGYIPIVMANYIQNGNTVWWPIPLSTTYARTGTSIVTFDMFVQADATNIQVNKELTIYGPAFATVSVADGTYTLYLLQEAVN